MYLITIIKKSKMVFNFFKHKNPETDFLLFVLSWKLCVFQILNIQQLPFKYFHYFLYIQHVLLNKIRL